MLYPAAAQDTHSPGASPDEAIRQAISNSLGITAIWRDKENTLLVQISGPGIADHPRHRILAV